MKLALSRRDFHLAAAQMVVGTMAGGSLLGASPVWAQSPKTVNLGTFGNIDAQNYIRAKGLASKTFGADANVNFVTVRSGSEIISAMAGNSLDMCNVGSSPMVVGYANGVQASLVYIYKNIVDSEALVVQNSANIKTLADLKGKRVGLPYNTSVHFAALAAFKTAGLGVNDVRLINMRADSIASAWTRREIDASYIWVPVIPKLVEDGGTVIFKTGDLNSLAGLVMFDAFLVRNEFKKSHPDLVLAFLKDFEQIAATFKQNPKEVVDTMTKFLGVDEAAVMRSLNTFYPVTAKEQLTDKWLGKPGTKDSAVVKTLQVQAEFLKETSQINALPKDMSGLVDSSFVAQMV
ncbi:MAG: ABC transporter substrate-binding protein [Gammaproteobacteria bacterium]|nr:ABC transporter substrate-binding protein [Gammaproteobacteria bacterium]MBU1443166.1 ABC transporter substrate-binding protein [Gammaproteobacteria bacterium]MBU2285200.1 ABC transporter substrate-binding protein [Gammaproteobacteria bacterium]MBU2407189.1 ABC transporter substrate-binding protein [Gammaproteobacteria bacterium]